MVLEAKLIRIIIIKLVLFYDYHSTVHFIENRFAEIIFLYFLKNALPVVQIKTFRLLCDDGNCGRYEVNVKNIRLTDLKIKICWGARPGTVRKVSKLP